MTRPLIFFDIAASWLNMITKSTTQGGGVVHQIQGVLGVTVSVIVGDAHCPRPKGDILCYWIVTLQIAYQ